MKFRFLVFLSTLLLSGCSSWFSPTGQKPPVQQTSPANPNTLQLPRELYQQLDRIEGNTIVTKTDTANIKSDVAEIKKGVNKTVAWIGDCPSACSMNKPPARKKEPAKKAAPPKAASKARPVARPAAPKAPPVVAVVPPPPEPVLPATPPVVVAAAPTALTHEQICTNYQREGIIAPARYGCPHPPIGASYGTPSKCSKCGR